MTVSMRVMSAGAGYRYLLDSVAVGDGQREHGRALVDYYTAEGCPPGRWLGSGLAGLDGELRPGAVVEEEQLARLLGEGRDPTSGAALGRAYPVYRPAAERIATRVEALDPWLAEPVREAAVARITAEEQSRGRRRAVAGYNLTFSVPKSVSVLWALADADVRATIVEAHHAAIADVIGLVEREVAATRLGATGGDGAVAQVDVVGVMAAAFDHYDSRAGDPQLHTHVVIANKVQTVVDGRWRSLDGRPVHAAMVSLSEHYNAVLADHLTHRLGLVWAPRDRGVDRNAGWELAAVPEALLTGFSSRSSAIEVATDDLVADYVAAHGRQPSATTMIRLRQQATLTTRPDKALRSLADLRARWLATASRLLGEAVDGWIRQVRVGGRRVQQQLCNDDVSTATVEGVARRVVEVVGERRSTWRRWNLHAEASRQLMGVRFASTHDREAVLHRLVDAAEQQSVRLTPPELAAVPAELRRADGTSVLRPRHSDVFTSADLLAAEDRLLDLGRTTTGPALPSVTIRAAAFAGELGADQAAAVASVATSGRSVDVLIGPAGAGKTIAMAALRSAWTGLFGEQSVIGLAPSAAAAQVLGDDLGVQADTLAKWLHDHRAGSATLSAGQLVIVDEASLAGTRTLHTIADHAATVGAKVLLVGDWAQLASVDAGGALQLLARDRDDIAELTDVRRFHHAWEAAATLQLRDGNPSVINTYATHGRLNDGETEEMLDAAYTAWCADMSAGKHSLLIAPTREQVTALNIRAQTDRIASGQVRPDGMVPLHDGTAAGVGDVVVTRRNDRRLHGPGGWVRNGDRWTITGTHPDGTLTVHRHGHRGTLCLPADYVAAHVELGYATTAHRAQGSTVDTAHAIVTPVMARETLYVAMTRGRHGNHAYISTDAADIEPHQHHEPPTARQVLIGVLARTGGEPSGHDTIAAEQNRLGGIAQLAAEYETIAEVAQRPRWTRLIERSCRTKDEAEQVIASDAFGSLCAALRHAEAYNLDPDQLLPNLTAARPLDDADDPAAVLHHRLDAAVLHHRQTRPVDRPDLIVGLIPAATGPMTPNMRTALQQRQGRIQQRAIDVLRTGLENDEPWIRHLGPPPRDHVQRRAWIRHAATVAAYRDRYAITTPTPIGPAPIPGVQPAYASAAADATRGARTISQTARLTHAGDTSRRAARVRQGPPTMS